MIKVKEVIRTKEVEVNDGYYFVKFRYNNNTGKTEIVARGSYKSRQYEPVYVPKVIFNAFVKRAYAVFYNSKKKKRNDPNQLVLPLEV